jgi:tripartite ATP-independent transporter DctP family solute receptor
MKRGIIAVLVILLMVSSMVFAQGAKDETAKTYKLRASTNLAGSGTIGRGLTKFVELVNEKSGGRIVATANYGAELGNQAEQVEMARTGSLEMVVAAPGTGPGTWVPQLMMFEFPYLFKDNEHYRRVLKGVEGEVSKLVQPYGFIALAGQSQGSRHMLTKRPVRQLSDLANMKMRGPNAVYVSMFEYLGAAGTTMDWNEIYTALQTGVVDGMEASPSMINSMKFQDVAKNLTITDHIIACTYYFFNEKWFNSLPADLQQIVREAADEATAYQAIIDDEDQEDSLAKMRAEGVAFHVPADRNAWIAATSPMLGEYRAKGADWNDFIDKLLAID